MKTKNPKINVIIGLYQFLLPYTWPCGHLRPTAPKATFYSLSQAAFLVAFFVISLISPHGHMATYLVSGINVAALDVCRNDYSNLNTYNV